MTAGAASSRAMRGRRLSSLVVAALAAMATTAPAGRRPRPGTPLAVTDLGWPADTATLVAPAPVKVYRTLGAGRRGRLASGTRTTWTRLVASRDRCRGWFELPAGGWVCARDVRPSADGPQPAADPAAITARVLDRLHLGVVPDGARAYPTVAAAVRGGRTGKKLPGWTFLHGATDAIAVGDRRFIATRRGVIAAERTEARQASRFAGLDLATTAPPSWPFAWVTPRRRELPVEVRAVPDPTAPAVATVERRAVVAVLAERDGFVQIAPDRWVARAELRIARTAARPAGVGADERWLDVDLDEQVLLAYQGDQPVYATLVSGGRGRSTPTGLHRIREKRAVARLKSPEIALGRWDVPDVPFAMTFRKHYAVHGAYWHDGFGKPRSQGCINVAPTDGRFLFEWTQPAVPPGWLSIQLVDDRGGTPIRLRNRKDPTPTWTDFDAPPPVRTRVAAEP